MSTPFSYSNHSGRRPGPLLRAVMLVSPGVRAVQRQVPVYADQWQEHNQAALSEQGRLWVALGDSMTQGVGASAFDRGWVGQLARTLSAGGEKYRVVNLSSSGARVRDVWDRQLPVLEALDVTPDLVTVLIGSNDLIRKQYRLALNDDFKALLERLPAGALVANLPGGHSAAQAINDQIRRAVAERGLRLADMRTMPGSSWRGRLAEDHFHPNDIGYAAMAEVFAMAIHAGSAKT